MEFSEAEFRKLLEMVCLADWVKNAHAEPDSTVNPYSLEQKIYKEAKAAGCGDWVTFNGKENVYVPSQNLEEKFHGVLDEYNDETFWEELVTRMAIRDVEEDKGQDALEKMSPDQQLRALRPLEERYQAETETHGIDRLEIVES
ncbi:MAG: hypothetical protein JNK54_05710 [Elusimicrobia bacterium]|nr:hypothetical protein [Elusimicrobiota bacterium]